MFCTALLGNKEGEWLVQDAKDLGQHESTHHEVNHMHHMTCRHTQLADQDMFAGAACGLARECDYECT